MRKTLFILLLFISLGLLKPVFAQGVCPTPDCGKCGGKANVVWTAFGCISTDPSSFVGSILGVAIGIGGGVAFLLILFGGFQILTSAGNPEQLTAGRELVTSAITGLLLIIFSIFLLKLIGYNIFGIPNFS